MPPANALVVRRRKYRDVVFKNHHSERSGENRFPVRVLDGVIADAAPHVLVLALPDGAQVRLPMTGTTSIWYGGRAGVDALRAGRRVTVRQAGTGRPAVERIWVDIARVAGVIADRAGGTFEIDCGPHRDRAVVTVPGHAAGKVRVRHPQLHPGALFDVIGIRRHGEILGLQPSRSSPQPAPHAVPTPSARRSDAAPMTFKGTATWYDRPDGLRGAAYPALDPYDAAGGCGAAPAHALPYLSLGSELLVRNECTAQRARVPIIECGCLAGRFHDRCVQCGTSPRGRIVELSKNAFVGLGGALDFGCFNVSVRMERP